MSGEPDFLADPAAARNVMANDRRIMETATPLEVEEVVTPPGGERRTWLSRKMPMRDETGAVVGLLGISRDITERTQAEEARRVSEERYRHAMETMIEGCAILSPNWTYLFANNVNAQQAHSTPGDMVGRSMFEVIPGVEKSPFFEAYRRCMEERTPQRVESAFTYENGAVAWFEAVAEPVAEGILVRAQDITARKRDEHALRESEELVRTIAENSTQALVMIDARGHCTYWNPALLVMTGYTAEELRSRPLHELIHHHRPDGRPYPMAECPIDRALAENFDVRAHEDLFFRKDSTSFPVLCAASPIMKGGRPVATVVEVRDITDRKQAEEALREQDKRKDEFIAVLAHELRNPLAPVRTAVEILRRLAPAEPRLMRAREVIDRQVTHMARLIDDLLDVSRIARGKLALQRERCDVAEIVRQTAEDYRSNLEAAGLNLEFEAPVTPLWVDGDPVRLAQMVGNLFNNAGRFTDRGGRVQVHVARSGPWVEVTVADTGVGIEPTLLSRLFDPFSQAEQDLARTKGGLGLGLAITKGLVELHGGEITAESPGPGRGSTFRLRLPASRDPAEQTVADAGPAQRTLRILVVEDNHDAAEMLGELLDLSGHEVKLAFDAVTALRLAREFLPQVVVSDLGLPGELDGYGLARALRREEGLRDAYLIALSGYASAEARGRSAAAGFDAHLAKPFDVSKLEATLAAASPR